MELDIYLPKELLALEYQGQQHYYDIYSMGNLWMQKKRDEEKRKACKDNHITLIEIPYWWDSKKESLMATIHQYRPDLISAGGQPIPSLPPGGIPEGIYILISLNFTDISLLGLVPELMHGEEWDGSEDLQGW
jgi:hypothetical protein